MDRRMGVGRSPSPPFPIGVPVPTTRRSAPEWAPARQHFRRPAVQALCRRLPPLAERKASQLASSRCDGNTLLTSRNALTRSVPGLLSPSAHQRRTWLRSHEPAGGKAAAGARRDDCQLAATWVQTFPRSRRLCVAAAGAQCHGLCCQKRRSCRSRSVQSADSRPNSSCQQ